MITEKQLEDHKQTVVRKGILPSLIFFSCSIFLMVKNIEFYFSYASIIELIVNILVTIMWILLLAYSYLEYLDRCDGIYLYTKGILFIENNNKVAYSYKEIKYFSEYNDIKKDEDINILTFNSQSSFLRRQTKFLFVLENKRVLKTIFPSNQKKINKISIYIPFKKH